MGVVLNENIPKSCSQRVGLCAGRDFCSTARPGRNSLVYGQSTNARSELQLLKILILSPGWRKAHVGCSSFSLSHQDILTCPPFLILKVDYCGPTSTASKFLRIYIVLAMPNNPFTCFFVFHNNTLVHNVTLVSC